MSGTLPYNNFKRVSVRSNSPTLTTVAVSGQRQSKGLGAQFWQISAEYSTLTRIQFNEIMGFINKQRGSLFQFNVIIPQLSLPSGDYGRLLRLPAYSSHNPTVAAAAPVGSTRLTLNTLSSSVFTANGANATVALRAGDFIKFAGHSKVYQIVETAAVVSSQAVIDIYPPLIFNVSTEQAVINNVPFQVFNTNASQEFQYEVNGNNSIILELQEAF
jgi:hypothetical protein